MFPPITLHLEDTVQEVEARLVKAIMDNAKKPGIKPIYTGLAVKQEVMRLYSNLQANLTVRSEN